MAVKGKVVALQFSGEVTPGLSFRRFLVATLRDCTAELAKAGAVAVVFVSDARAQVVYEHWSHTYERGRYDLPDGPNVHITTTIPNSPIWPAGCTSLAGPWPTVPPHRPTIPISSCNGSGIKAELGYARLRLSCLTRY